MNLLSSLSLVTICLAKATELDKDTLQPFLDDNEIALIKFYAPWCGHCKRMAPEFDDAAEKLEGKVALAKIDVDNADNKPLASEYGVNGFPTLKFFHDGDMVTYDGGRTSPDIVKWVQAFIGPAVNYVNNEKELKEQFADSVVLSYCGPQDDSVKLYSTFKKTAEKNRGKVTFVANKDCKEPTIELYRKDDSKVTVDEPKNPAHIMKFIKKNKLGYFEPIGPNNAKEYTGSGLKVVYFGGSKMEYKMVKPMVEEIAKQFRDTHIFTFLDRDQFAKQAEGMLRTKKFPAFVHTRDGKQGVYKFDDEDKFNKEELTKWMNDLVNGNLEVQFQSEDIPESNDEPVKIVVSKNFTEMVSDDKDVFIEVYAPWCGVCKTFAPTYDEIATKLAQVAPQILVAKIDGSSNDIPVEGYKFKGFPTLFFKKAGGAPELYNGERTAADILSYIQKETGLQVKDEL